MNRKKTILLIIDVILMGLFVFLDQLSKYYAALKLKGGEPFVIADGIFELHYLENNGAAFGMLQGQKPFFIFIAAVVLAVIVYVILRTPYQRIYIKLNITLVLIASGAVGNLIDRIRYNYVIDFLYFSLINFPIFNVADIYVTVASFYLIILLLFVYKENDLDFLTFRARKFRDVK